MENTEVLKKILKARNLIKESPIKRAGKNKYSDYDYFTPDQVSSLVQAACQEVNLLTVFSLLEDDLGLFGSLSVVDVDSGGEISTIMRTKVPSIKATNETQQMGGCETYTKRYMLMSMFDISDNNLDFDSQDNRPSKESEGNPKAVLKKRGLKKQEEKEENTDVSAGAEKIDDDEANMFKSLINELNGITSSDEVKECSSSIIEKATVSGMRENLIIQLKDKINSKYKELKKNNQ